MRRFHLARAAILARVAGLRESVVPLLRLWTWGGFLGIRTRFVDYGLENRSLRRFRKFGHGGFHKFRLPLVNWGLGVVGRKAKKCYPDLRLKLARSSASSQSNVVFVSGFSPSLEQFSIK